MMQPREMTLSEAKSALENARAIVKSRIFDIEAEGRKRSSAGRTDLADLVHPLKDAQAAFAVVNELEKMLEDAERAPEKLRQAVIDKIALGLAGFDFTQDRVKH